MSEKTNALPDGLTANTAVEASTDTSKKSGKLSGTAVSARHSSIFDDPELMESYKKTPMLMLHEMFKADGLYWWRYNGKQCVVQAKESFDFYDVYAFSYEGLQWVLYHPPTDKADEKFTINEPLLCYSLASHENLHHINGRFYNESGVLSDDAVKVLIQKRVTPFISSNVARLIDSIFKLLTTTTHIEPPVPDTLKVYAAEGRTISFSEAGAMTTSTELDAVTLNRLPIKYDAEATCPRFNQYISELLTDEDIMVVQEFCGYMLLPTTKAQVALFLRGDGGEGKSVLLNVLSAIMGASATSGDLATLATNRFKLATL